MADETWRGIIIRSIPPTAKWLPVIPSLYTLSSSADVISTLLAHGMILGRYTTNKGGNSSNTVLAARTFEPCTNPNCKAKKRSTHSILNCYWPGGGKEGQVLARERRRTPLTHLPHRLLPCLPLLDKVKPLYCRHRVRILLVNQGYWLALRLIRLSTAAFLVLNSLIWSWISVPSAGSK